MVVRQEALYALANICNNGVDDHVKTLVEFDGLRALTAFLDQTVNVSLLLEVLHAINRILEVGETETWLQYDRYFHEYIGIERLEEVVDRSQSPQLCEVASNILDRFFPSQGDLDENLAPETSPDGMTTAFDCPVRKKLKFDFNSPQGKVAPKHGTNNGFGFSNRGL